LVYYRQARDLQEELGVPRGVALCCRRIGDLLLTMGRPADAVVELRRAESLMARLGDATQHARSLMFLAKAQAGTGSTAEAESALRTALASMRRLGSVYYQAEILTELGELAVRTGGLSQARDHLAAALALYEQVEEPAAARVRARLAELSG
jgi:hypothetical protein